MNGGTKGEGCVNGNKSIRKWSEIAMNKLVRDKVCRRKEIMNSENFYEYKWERWNAVKEWRET